MLSSLGNAPQNEFQASLNAVVCPRWATKLARLASSRSADPCRTTALAFLGVEGCHHWGLSLGRVCPCPHTLCSASRLLRGSGTPSPRSGLPPLGWEPQLEPPQEGALVPV